jgi:hypothetical protein
MLPNAFIGNEVRPTDDQLSSVLGPAKKLWDQLLTDLKDQAGIDSREWGSSSRKAGWSLRAKHNGRVIVYLSPGRNSFMASFALGDKAIAALRQSKLPARILKIVDHGKRYAEGTAVRIEVREIADIEAIATIAIAKVNN